VDADELLDEDRRQSRVPQPLTGSPRGGRVMRVRGSGDCRIASNVRNSSRRSPSECRPVSPLAGRVGTRQTRDLRLREDEHAEV